MSLSRSIMLACVAPLTLLTACSAEKSEETSASAASEAVDAAGPEINRSVAPGVAFTFAYAFELPAKTISTVQQEHAAACAKLGTTRCRVTGMSFEQPGADEARGRLDFLLAPDIAHAFGSTAVALVEKADGKLDNAAIQGENAGDQIVLSQHDSAAAEAEIKRIEARLAAKGLTSRERAELQSQIGNLRREIDSQVSTRRRLEKSIATTPVSFTYASQGLIGGTGTFGKAAAASWSSLQGMLSFVALAFGLALPWLVLIGLIVVILRSPLLRRLLGKTPSAEPAAPQ
jgi:hypothetical protein